MTSILCGPLVEMNISDGFQIFSLQWEQHVDLRHGFILLDITDLRHTAASHMIMNGVDIVTVKEILGHKSLTMTLRYAHLAPSHRRKAVDALEKCYDFATLGEKTGNSDSQLCLFPKSKKAATY